jgi:hypothetical protein
MVHEPPDPAFKAHTVTCPECGHAFLILDRDHGPIDLPQTPVQEQDEGRHPVQGTAAEGQQHVPGSREER